MEEESEKEEEKQARVATVGSSAR
eukprot:COSAG05_NODE_349_length_10936_cov_9.714404_1_plen_23_part_10